MKADSGIFSVNCGGCLQQKVWVIIVTFGFPRGLFKTYYTDQNVFFF